MHKMIKPVGLAVGILVLVLTGLDGQSGMSPVALPITGGSIVGAGFSPDSKRLALLVDVASGGAPEPRRVLQILKLDLGRVVNETDVLKTEPASLSKNLHWIFYSPDERYLLLATYGSDVLSILDATTLNLLGQVALHPRRELLNAQRHYFKGVVNVSSSSDGDLFGVLTHDELGDNEVFIGSYSSRQIKHHWSIGNGRTTTQLGQNGLSLNKDGSNVVVSILPAENRPPKTFKNIRMYSSATGQLVKSIRTDGLAGQLILLPDEQVLISRIDVPSIFSSRACIEEWNLSTGTLAQHFCDETGNVSVALGASLARRRVAGFASQMHKTIEGHVYAASGRVDVWDIRSGDLIASSAEIPRLVASVKIAPDGGLVLADGDLLRGPALRGSEAR